MKQPEQPKAQTNLIAAFIKMPMNKDRLYVGLYARGGGDRMPGGEDR